MRKSLSSKARDNLDTKIKKALRVNEPVGLVAIQLDPCWANYINVANTPFRIAMAQEGARARLASTFGSEPDAAAYQTGPYPDEADGGSLMLSL